MDCAPRVAVQLSLEDGLPYDLACLDIMMPGKDGHQTLAGIRALEKEHGVWGSAGLKVIMTRRFANQSIACKRSVKDARAISPSQLMKRNCSNNYARSASSKSSQPDKVHLLNDRGRFASAMGYCPST